MQDRQIMQLILMGVLLCSGYLFAFRQTASKAAGSAKGPAAAVLLLVYGIFCGVFCLLIRQAMGQEMMLPAVLLMMVFYTVICGGRWMMKNFRQANALALMGMVLYLALVGYVTVFSREALSGMEIRLGFEALREAVSTGSMGTMRHFLENMVLFMPLGLLLPLLKPRQERLFVLTLAAALFLTAAIESVQLMMNLGQIDVEDLAANGMGALIGFGLYRLAEKQAGK